MQTYFTLNELTRSQTAIRRNIDNTPDDEIKANLNDLIEHVLLPVRLHFNSPVIVTSGYRSPALNKAIGGSKTSDHCKGRAADFTVVGHSDLEVAHWIAENCKFRQLILEFPPHGWVHCAYAAEDLKGEVLTAVKVGGKTIYARGLARL